MFYSGCKTVKLFVVAIALSLILLGLFGVNLAPGEDKKITVKLVWEKETTGIENYLDFLQAANNYFKLAESRILNPSAAEGKRVVVLYDKILFLDGQDKIIKQITLRKNNYLDPDTGKAITQEAVISEDAQNAGVLSRIYLPIPTGPDPIPDDVLNAGMIPAEDSFTFYDVDGNVLWKVDAGDGSTFSTAFISNKEQKIILVKEPIESSPNPYTIVFLNKNREVLKEYKKEGFIIEDYRKIIYNFGNIDILWEHGNKKILTRLDTVGNLVLEKDVSNYLVGADISVSGKYYGVKKKEGTYYFYYIFDREDNLIKKIQLIKGGGFSDKGDYVLLYNGIEEQIIDLNTGLPIWSYDSRSIPGEEPNNVERLFTDISKDGNYILYSLIRKEKGKPSWVVLLDKNKKKIWQETFSQCANESKFSNDGNFIRVYLKKCNLLRLYRIEGK
jgi:hypothetical protein